MPLLCLVLALTAQLQCALCDLVQEELDAEVWDGADERRSNPREEEREGVWRSENVLHAAEHVRVSKLRSPRTRDLHSPPDSIERLGERMRHGARDPTGDE